MLFCLNVRETRLRFATRLVLGGKGIETRSIRAFSILVAHGLKEGMTVGIVSNHRLIGTVDVVGFRFYESREEFRKDYSLHLVGPGSSFDYNDMKGKVGIIVSNPRVLPTSVELDKMNHPCGYRIIA